MSVFAVTEPTACRVEIQVGRVDVVATSRADITVHASPSNPNRYGDRSATERVRVDQAGGVVRVTGPSRLNLFGSGDSVDVVVEVPLATAVSVEVKYGSVNATGQLDVCRLDVPYGDVRLESATRLDLTVGHGDVRIGHVAGDAEVRLKSGSTRFGRVDGSLRLNGSNASVVVDSVGSAADVTTASGGVELGRVGGNLTVRSAYGAVRLAELVRGSARVEGSYGAIDVGIRRGTAVWLEARSQHGVVRTDLPAGAGPSDHDETLELRIHTGYGDITVHRSDATALPN